MTAATTSMATLRTSSARLHYPRSSRGRDQQPGPDRRIVRRHTAFRTVTCTAAAPTRPWPEEHCRDRHQRCGRHRRIFDHHCRHFRLSRQGRTFSLLKDPSATGNTYAIGINDAGQIVGYYNNNSGVHGFLDSGGGYKLRRSQCHRCHVQPASTPRARSRATTDGSGAHGFLFSGGGYTTLDDPLATNGTFASGINDAGDIVGHYYVGSSENGLSTAAASIP